MNREVYKLKVWGLISIALLLAACASQPRTQTDVASAESAVSEAPSAATPVPTSLTISDVVKLIRDHGSSMYKVGDDSYQFFVGGLIDAKYFPGDKRLSVSDASANDGLTCNYTIEGNLQTEADEDAAKEFTQGCESLVKKLSGLLVQ